MKAPAFKISAGAENRKKNIKKSMKSMKKC